MVEYDPKSWLHLIFRWRGSVYSRLLFKVGISAGLGIVAALLNETYSFKLPNSAHALVGVALGLLLVFRTNASYDRWWEGRKLLGAMVNRSRDLTRQFATLLPAHRADDARVLTRHVTLFYQLAALGLRLDRDLQPLVNKGLLLDSEKLALESVGARGPVVLGWISARVARLAKEGDLSELRLMGIDVNITSLQDSLGACERIAKTPLPFAYAQHLKALVTLFVLTAPFVLVDPMKWNTPLAMAALAFALFGIDEIGIEIEDPFGHDDNDLPIEKIGEGIIAATGDVLAHAADLENKG
jgi:ion channel-forming bestrophin family protein